MYEMNYFTYFANCIWFYF